MIKYYKSVTDSNAFVHSIDNVKCFYYLSADKENVLEKIRSISAKHNLGTAYYENLEKKPSVRWNFWENHIHLDFIYIRLGKYVLKSLPNDKKSYDVIDCMSVEVNPNKHCDTELFGSLLELIQDVSADGYLDQIDYAIDIACIMDDIVVLKTRKEHGLYKGTKYYGIRGQNGFVRIYNKSIEAKLDYPLTRIETCYKIGKRFSSVDFGIVDHTKSADDKLSNSTGLMVDMLKELQLLGSDNIGTYIERMNYRTRVQVQSRISGTPIMYVSNPVILDELIQRIKDLFLLSDSPQEVEFNNNRQLLEDSEGFLYLPEGVDDDDFYPF